jgi:hypothetical protein
MGGGPYVWPENGLAWRRLAGPKFSPSQKGSPLTIMIQAAESSRSSARASAAQFDSNGPWIRFRSPGQRHRPMARTHGRVPLSHLGPI